MGLEMGANAIIDLYTAGLDEVKDSALSMLESSIGENIAKQVGEVLDKFGIDRNITLATVGAILVGCSEDGNTFDKTIGRILTRTAVSGIVERVRKAVHSDPKIEKALKEEGALHGITDPVLLVQQVAAIYATEAAKSSRFHAYSCGFNDYNENDDWRFNAPGAEGITCTLDLANLDKLDGKQVQITVSCGDKYQVDDLRAAFTLDNGTCIESLCTPEYKKALKLAQKTGMLNDYPLGGMWPNPVYDISETLTKKRVMDETPIIHTPGIEVPESVWGKRAWYRTYGFNPKALHTRLTEILDRQISPLLMQSEKEYNYPNIAMVNGIPMFAHPSFYTVNPNGAIVSVYSAGELANERRFNIGGSSGIVGSEDMVIDAEATVATDVKVETKEPEPAPAKQPERKFPISKDKCKQKDGAWVCPRCGSTVKKNQLNSFLPKAMPEGCLADNEGNTDLQEAILWAGSAICGVCADQLKKVREKVSSEWLRVNKGIVEASKEVEAAEAEWVKADDALKSAEAELSKLDDAVKTLGNNLPDAFKEAHEKARFNVQSAKGVVANIKVKLEAATNKRNALVNGTAKPAIALPAAPTSTTTTATKSKAVVVKPAETKKMNRQQRRAAKRAAEAARK